jgi:hypothetical protein
MSIVENLTVRKVFHKPTEATIWNTINFPQPVDMRVRIYYGHWKKP